MPSSPSLIAPENDGLLLTRGGLLDLFEVTLGLVSPDKGIDSSFFMVPSMLEVDLRAG